MRTLSCVCALLFCFATSPASAHETSASLYNLNADLTDQAGASHGLDMYRGHLVLVTLFYGRCPAACPLLIDTLRSIERTTSVEQRHRLRVLLISIDPQRDTPAALAELARSRHIDNTRWTLARTNEKSVRKIAALLNVQYRKLPNGEYNHSSVITLLTPTGEIAGQSTTLGKVDEALITAIEAQ